MQVHSSIIYPKSRGRNWTADSSLPFSSQRLFDHAMQVYDWCHAVANHPETSHRFSVFLPLENDHWLLGRTEFMGEVSSGVVGQQNGIILSRAQLDHIEWSPHRLLNLITPKTGMTRKIVDIDLDQMAPRGGSLVEYWNKSAPPKLILESPHEAKTDLTSEEVCISHIADISSVAGRPRGWCTTGLLRTIGSVDPARDFDLIAHPKGQRIDQHSHPAHRKAYGLVP